MDEARLGIYQRYRAWKRLKARPCLPRKRKWQSGQAMIEYILLVALMVVFAKFVFFDSQYGFMGMMNKGMMRVGTALEQNLKSGTGPIPRGQSAQDPYAGIGNWLN